MYIIKAILILDNDGNRLVAKVSVFIQSKRLFNEVSLLCNLSLLQPLAVCIKCVFFIDCLL